MSTESRVANPALMGIGFMCLGMMMFSLNDAMGKWLLGSYGVGQLLLIRSLAALVVLGPAMWREGRALLMPQKPWLNLFRIALSTLEVSFFYWAVSYLPLAETTTFWLAVPIYVALLAVPLLGEHIPARRWVAIAIGFCGVLLAVQPGGALFGWPSLIALVGSMAFAAMMIVTRKLRGTPDITLVAWQTFAALVGGAIFAPFNWVPPTLLDTAMFSLLGIVAMLAHVATNRALKLAPASVVVPYQYTLIFWAVIAGWFVFREIPAWTTLAGAGIIIVAGLLIFWDEARGGREDLIETEGEVRE